MPGYLRRLGELKICDGVHPNDNGPNMKTNTPKTPPAPSKGAKGKIKKERLIEEDRTKNVPSSRGEGRNNLRQRAKWFRHRTSGAVEK